MVEPEEIAELGERAEGNIEEARELALTRLRRTLGDVGGDRERRPADLGDVSGILCVDPVPTRRG